MPLDPLITMCDTGVLQVATQELEQDPTSIHLIEGKGQEGDDRKGRENTCLWLLLDLYARWKSSPMSEGKQRMAVEVRRQHLAVELGKASNTGIILAGQCSNLQVPDALCYYGDCSTT